MPKLTPKQERFVQEYFKTSNQRKSYQHAYNAEGMSDNAVDREACLLLKNPKVAQRLAEMQERVAKKAEVTVETISDMLDQAFAKAAQDDKGSAAMVAAAMGKAKLHGLIVEKKEDVTKRRASAEIDARINSLLDARREDGAGGPSGRTEAGEGQRETVPNVPGHGTA